MQTRIFGYFNQGTGYGETARQFARAVSLLGEDVCSRNIYTDLPAISLPGDMADFLNSHQVEREPHVSIYCTIPMHFQDLLDCDFDAHRRIGWTMSEGQGTLCKGYVQGCSLVDEVWVPTAYNKKIFEDSGVKTPVYVVPLGVDTDFFSPPSRQIRRRRRDAPFTFITNFSWAARYRKGFDLLLRAYFDEFSEADNVRLIVKTAGDKAEIRKLIDLATVVMRLKNPPKLDIANGFCDPAKVLQLYQEADCFVLPTRAEAWCLPALEAMSCGLPVIITGEGGQLEFCNVNNSLLLEITGYQPPPAYEKLIYSSLQWAEPNWEHLAYLMRWAYKHHGAARTIGARGRDTAQCYDWSRVAEIATKNMHEREDQKTCHEPRFVLL